MNENNLNIIINLVKKKIKHKLNNKNNSQINSLIEDSIKTKFSSYKLFDFDIWLKNINFGITNIFNILTWNEFIIFYFYFKNKNYYNKVLDIGMNIGLHSIILKKLKFDVTSIEPDPNHIIIAKQFFKKNKVNIKIIQKAISDRNGKDKFIRINDNTTGSCLKGTKSIVYGSVDEFSVKTICFKEIVNKFDLIKIDCEGGEKKIFSSTNLNDWKNTDAIIEITDNESRKIIYNLFKKTNFLYSQKIGWRNIKKISDLPKNYKEGSVFLSSKRSFDMFM
jgi:FkbM family methyltransferase